jgi:Ser/Thr protein kinase RdoA (MazF antagonist)
LTRNGFQGAPGPIALDSDTELLTYLEGEAAIDPIPTWALTTDALTGVGALLREFHHSTASFDSAGWSWQRPVPPPWRRTLVTHNDTHPANIIFGGGRPVGIIDFDLAGPGCAAWELAVAACFWAPLQSDDDIADSRRGCAPERFRLLLDGYGADTALRHEVVEACLAANQWIADIIEDGSHLGHPAFARLWDQRARTYARAHDWLIDNRATLEEAVT